MECECVSESVFVEYRGGEKKYKNDKDSQNKGFKVHVQLYSLHNVSLESNARGTLEKCAWYNVNTNSL